MPPESNGSLSNRLSRRMRVLGGGFVRVTERGSTGRFGDRIGWSRRWTDV